MLMHKYSKGNNLLIMSNLNDFVNLISNLGVSHLSDKLQDRVSDVKKSALLIYMVNLLLSALSTIVIISLLVGLIFYSPSLKSTFSNFSPKDFFIIALFCSLIVVIIFLITFITIKFRRDKKPEFDKKELISRLVPLAENLVLTYVESKLKSEQNIKPIDFDKVSQDNEELKRSIATLQNQINNLSKPKGDI